MIKILIQALTFLSKFVELLTLWPGSAMMIRPGLLQLLTRSSRKYLLCLDHSANMIFHLVSIRLITEYIIVTICMIAICSQHSTWLTVKIQPQATWWLLDHFWINKVTVGCWWDDLGLNNVTVCGLTGLGMGTMLLGLWQLWLQQLTASVTVSGLSVTSNEIFVCQWQCSH